MRHNYLEIIGPGQMEFLNTSLWNHSSVLEPLNTLSGSRHNDMSTLGAFPAPMPQEEGKLVDQLSIVEDCKQAIFCSVVSCWGRV